MSELKKFIDTQLREVIMASIQKYDTLKGRDSNTMSKEHVEVCDDLCEDIFEIIAQKISFDEDVVSQWKRVNGAGSAIPYFSAEIDDADDHLQQSSEY